MNTFFFLKDPNTKANPLMLTQHRARLPAVLLFLAILDHFLFLVNFCLLHFIKFHCGLHKNDLNLCINLDST